MAETRTRTVTRERRKRETMRPLSPEQTKQPAKAEPGFTDDEEAFFRAGDELASE